MRKNLSITALVICNLILLPYVGKISWANEQTKTMRAQFTADVHWEIDEGQNIRKGSMTLNAETILELDRAGSGLDHSPLLTPLALQYNGDTFNGTLSFEETLTQKEAQPPNCDPLLEEYKDTKVFSFSAGNELGKEVNLAEDYKTISLSVQRFNIISKQVKSLASGENAQQFLAQLMSQMEVPPSTYQFNAGGISDWQIISGKKRKIEKNGCSYINTDKKVTFSTIGLKFPLLEDNMSIEGSETWQTSIDRPPKNFSIKLSQTDVNEEIEFRPSDSGETGGVATYSITWFIGDATWTPPDVKIQKVFFKYQDDYNQEKCLQLWEHSIPTEKRIESPEWVLGRDKNKPAAFVIEHPFKIKAEFSSSRPVKSAKIRAIETVIKGQGFGGELEQAGDLEIFDNKIIGYFVIKNAQETIGTHNVSWKWEGEIELEDEPGGHIKTDLGKSEHVVYIVGGVPPNAFITAYEYAVKLGCKWAGGTQGGEDTFWYIWKEFKHIPAPDVSLNGYLRYEHEYLQERIDRTNDLLANGAGKCGAWADFLKNIVGVHGLDIKTIVIKPKPPYGILVTEPAPGQENPEPDRAFIDHAVVLYNNQYFDPSYMVGPVESLIEFENKMFKGYCKRKDIDNYRTAGENRLGPCSHIGANEISELADCLIDCPDHNSCHPNDKKKCEVSATEY
jgi:hypothetical protein